MNRIDPSSIQATLTTRAFGRELVYLPHTGSTNDVAKDLAAQGAPEGTVVLADEQMTGRGRMGRRWLAPPGTCLLCSILFRPHLPPAQAQRLTMLCSLAAADAVEQVAGLRVSVKWPNDLVVKSQISNLKSRNWCKLAGVLTETGVIGEQVKSQIPNPKSQNWCLEYVIVGIGINVNVEPDALPTLAPDATSVLAEVGRRVDRGALLVALLDGVERRYEALQAGASPHREWEARLATLGQPVVVTTSEGVLTGVAESVDEDGALLLRTPDGALRRLLAGDVTLDRRADEA
ncbi:MAG TPA: biotin--[acetyl-CoA-carboxylase] ligase [Anaerolineae bacterium]|nr:biotin--[acetyl-CoA-carboxylase] ligase [Anaerolineae bacterium]